MENSIIMFQTALQSTSKLAREPSLVRQEMQANAERAVPRATVLHFRRARNTPLCNQFCNLQLLRVL